MRYSNLFPLFRQYCEHLNGLVPHSGPSSFVSHEIPVFLSLRHSQSTDYGCVNFCCCCVSLFLVLCSAQSLDVNLYNKIHDIDQHCFCGYALTSSEATMLSVKPAPYERVDQNAEFKMASGRTSEFSRVGHAISLGDR